MPLSQACHDREQSWAVEKVSKDFANTTCSSQGDGVQPREFRFRNTRGSTTQLRVASFAMSFRKKWWNFLFEDLFFGAPLLVTPMCGLQKGLR